MEAMGNDYKPQTNLKETKTNPGALYCSHTVQLHVHCKDHYQSRTMELNSCGVIVVRTFPMDGSLGDDQVSLLPI